MRVLLIALIVFMSGECYGVDYEVGFMPPENFALEGQGIVSQLPPDLTYFKDHRKGDTLTPDFTLGDKTYTYAASRGASNPQTYFDADGVMQKTITSDTYHKNHFYYDDTGIHKAPAFFQQGAQTNYFRQSIFATDTDNAVARRCCAFF